MSNGIAGGDMAGTRGGDHVSVPRFLLEDSPQLARKIQNFEDLERRAAEATATIGDVGEIASIKGQAKQARDEADAELAKQKEVTAHARAECERLISEATATASNGIAKAEIEAKRLTENAQSVMATAESTMREATSATKEAVALKQEMDTKGKFLQQKADALVSREQELTETKEQFARLRTLIQQNLP